MTYEDPRWNPAGDQILFVVRHNSPSGPTSFSTSNTTHIFDLASGRATQVPINAEQATWAWDAQRLVYLLPGKGPLGTGNSLRIANLDGTGDRELLTSNGNESLTGIASVNY